MKLGAAATWRVHSSQLAFEREKHAESLRQERRTRLGGLYKDTLHLMMQAHPRINLQRRSPDEDFAGWCHSTSNTLLGLSLEWRVNQVPAVTEELEKLRSMLWPFTIPDFDDTRFVDGDGVPITKDLVGLDRQVGHVSKALDTAYSQPADSPTSPNKGPSLGWRSPWTRRSGGG